MKQMWIRKCNSCGCNNADNAKICHNCHQKFEKSVFDYISADFADRYTFMWACPKCRTINQKENTKCHGCLWTASSGACFLTTIVCHELGLDDNCTELTLMRKLRSDYLLNSEKGRDIIDDYQAISRDIAPKIIQLKDKNQYCEWLMSDYIQPVCELVVNHEFEAATNKYLTLVNEVKKLV